MEKEKKERKKSTLKKFYPYMGKRKFLIPLSLLGSIVEKEMPIHYSNVKVVRASWPSA